MCLNTVMEVLEIDETKQSLFLIPLPYPQIIKLKETTGTVQYV